jgi:type III restriction enzyme
MIINIQAFNASGEDNAAFMTSWTISSRASPSMSSSSNRPILILDEPQKMEGKATTEALPKFKPLMILRYSATHKTERTTRCIGSMRSTPITRSW